MDTGKPYRRIVLGFARGRDHEVEYRTYMVRAVSQEYALNEATLRLHADLILETKEATEEAIIAILRIRPWVSESTLETG